VGVGVLVGVVAAVAAGATIWLLLTDPVSVAGAFDGREASPLVLRVADIVFEALLRILDYL
jgi:hypothetical protein